MYATNAVKAAWWAWKPARAVRLKRPEAGCTRPRRGPAAVGNRPGSAGRLK